MDIIPFSLHKVQGSSQKIYVEGCLPRGSINLLGKFENTFLSTIPSL